MNQSRAQKRKNQNKKANPRPRKRARVESRAPVATTRRTQNRAPKIQSLPSGSVRISHREYLADMSGSIAFSSSSFAVNPGIARSFPWLSKVASRFESYRFDSLRFSFETEAPTSATGSVMLAIDYDPTDAAPLTKTALLSYEGAVRSAPWSHSEYRARKADLAKRKSYFVRCGALAAGKTLSLHDTGNLFVCTKGQASAAVVGELYVEYDVLLSTPQLEPSVVSKRVYGVSGISNAAVFGTDPVLNGCLDLSTAGSTITFNQAGEVLLIAQFTGSGIAAGPVTSASTATVSALSSVINGAGTLVNSDMIVRFNTGETLVLDCTAYTTVTQTWLRAGEYEYSLG